MDHSPIRVFFVGPQGTGKSWTANRLYLKEMGRKMNATIDDDLDDDQQKFPENCDPQGKMLQSKDFLPKYWNYTQKTMVDGFVLIDTVGIGSFTDKARRDQPNIILKQAQNDRSVFVFVSPHDYVLMEDLELDLQHYSNYCKPERILVFLNKRNAQVKETRVEQVKETFRKGQKYYMENGLCCDIDELIEKIKCLKQLWMVQTA